MEGNNELKPDIEAYNCPICFCFIAEPFETPCKHLICLSCIKVCLQSQSSCPMWRTELGNVQLMPHTGIQNRIMQEYPEIF